MCHGATKTPMDYNYWSHILEPTRHSYCGCMWQLLKPKRLQPISAAREATVVRSPCPALKSGSPAHHNQREPTWLQRPSASKVNKWLKKKNHNIPFKKINENRAVDIPNQAYLITNMRLYIIHYNMHDTDIEPFHHLSFLTNVLDTWSTHRWLEVKSQLPSFQHPHFLSPKRSISWHFPGSLCP